MKTFLQDDLKKELLAILSKVENHNGLLRVYPETIRQLRGVLVLLSQIGVSVLPPFAPPADGHIYLDLSCLSRIVEYNEASGYILVQAGVRISELSEFLLGRGLGHGFIDAPPEMELWEYLLRPLYQLPLLRRGSVSNQVEAVWALLPGGENLDGSTAPGGNGAINWKNLIFESCGSFALPTMFALRVFPLEAMSYSLLIAFQEVDQIRQLLPLVFGQADMRLVMGECFQQGGGRIRLDGSSKVLSNLRDKLPQRKTRGFVSSYLGPTASSQELEFLSQRWHETNLFRQTCKAVNLNHKLLDDYFESEDEITYSSNKLNSFTAKIDTFKSSQSSILFHFSSPGSVTLAGVKNTLGKHSPQGSGRSIFQAIYAQMDTKKTLGPFFASLATASPEILCLD